MSLLTHAQVLSAAVAGSFHDAVLAMSPWGYWKLDENPPASAGVAADSSGNGRHGTYTADTFTTGAGLFGCSPRSPVFAAANTQGVTLPNFSQAGAFSLFCFFTSTSTGLGQLFSGDVGIGASRMWQARLGGGASSLPAFYGVNGGGGALGAVGALPVNDGNPHMAVCVYDGSLPAGSGQIKLYVDGVLAASTTLAFTPAPGPTTPTIGNRGNNDGWFTGRISNAALFQRALSGAEVATLWARRNST